MDRRLIKPPDTRLALAIGQTHYTAFILFSGY